MFYSDNRNITRRGLSPQNNNNNNNNDNNNNNNNNNDNNNDNTYRGSPYRLFSQTHRLRNIVSVLRLPDTFRGVSRVSDVARSG